MWMFVGTMGLLLAPKLMGFIVVLIRRDDRRGCGGAIRLLLGVLIETVIAGLLAPITMLTQSFDVLSILAGRDSGWKPQRREGGASPLSEIARRYRGHTVLGAAMGGTAWLISPSLALWMSPVVLGLTLAIPLVALTSLHDRVLRRLGLLRIPEEARPPTVLARAAAYARELADSGAPSTLDRLARDRALLAAHRAMLPGPRQPWVDPPEVPLLTGRLKLEEAPSLPAAWAAMSNEEQAACLADAAALDLMVARSSEGAEPVAAALDQRFAPAGA
jgi:membrane glycosyltransferase